MRATMSRSAARSDSVTRSMSPLFDTCKARPNLSARIFPASLAVWMAKLSKSLLLEYRHDFSLDGPARDFDLLVGDDGAGLLQLLGDVEEDEVAAADGGAAL